MIQKNFDSVVMLTMSDWATEFRSNRYHYATRFAKHSRVFFVQPDLGARTFRLEPSGIPNLEILHIYKWSGPAQAQILSSALRSIGVVRPLLWIYNPGFCQFIEKQFSPLKVFHATEDFFCDDFTRDMEVRDKIRTIFNWVDLVVPVSEGVLKSLTSRGGYRGRVLLLTNGVDLNDWAIRTSDKVIRKSKPNIAIYQGNLNLRIDLPFLIAVANRLPNWTFKFCGRVVPVKGYDWNQLFNMPNVQFLGPLPYEALVREVQSAKVGLIPFVDGEWLRVIGYPLKALEYVAAGLHVVSTPNRNLEDMKEHFSFYNNADEFVEILNKCESDNTAIDQDEIRRALARHSYDVKFERLLVEIENIFTERQKRNSAVRLNVLVLFDPKSMKVTSTAEHLESFERFSKHRIFYAPATIKGKSKIDLSPFDAVVVHYSVRTSIAHMVTRLKSRLANYAGPKMLFIQDEYDNVRQTINFIKETGCQFVYTCVPKAEIHKVYPPSQLPGVRFIENLTGYVSVDLQCIEGPPTFERDITIGYRGRDLPAWYGDLGQEKIEIGQKFKAVCQSNGIKEDIEWNSEKRIYGPGWREFLKRCRFVLGTESGSNVFDFDGTLPGRIGDYQRENPGASYSEIKQKFFADQDGLISMNQISPKIFEAIALKTGLILYEGNYSGVVEPYKHYIPLKKDFSNLSEVLRLIEDRQFVESMTERAYNEIISSNKYSYQALLSSFDDTFKTFSICPSNHLLLNRSQCVANGRIKDLRSIGDFGFVDYTSNLRHRPIAELNGKLIRLSAIFAYGHHLIRVTRHFILASVKQWLRFLSVLGGKSPDGLEIWVKRQLGRSL